MASTNIVPVSFEMVSLNHRLFSQKSGAFNFLKFVPISFGMVSLNRRLFNQKKWCIQLFEVCPRFFWNDEFEPLII